MTKPIKQVPPSKTRSWLIHKKHLPPIYRGVENKETYPFGHGEFHTTRISFQNLTRHNPTSFRTHVSNLDFRFLHRLYHESIILGQIEDASTFPRRRKLPKSIIPTYSQHVVSRIHLKQLSQMPTIQTETQSTKNRNTPKHPTYTTPSKNSTHLKTTGQ